MDTPSEAAPQTSKHVSLPASLANILRCPGLTDKTWPKSSAFLPVTALTAGSAAKAAQSSYSA